ncbi:MAG: response regulator transcription factor [Gemmatimonadota bacterium]|nr:MAG: response regulator transcription factor [Gemmatimonadota bacterium]
MTHIEPTVFVVDDDPGVLESLKLLLRSVGLAAETFASAHEFLEAYDPEKPGCVVLDVRMPDMSGLELQDRLRALESTLPIIFITAHGDVPMAVKAVKTGAVDFIQKPFRDQELIDRIQHAIEDNARNREQVRELKRYHDRMASLTPRERQVMELVVEGKANKVIASELGLSQRTVEIHRARVMKKMEASSVSSLVQMVMRAGK